MPDLIAPCSLHVLVDNDTVIVISFKIATLKCNWQVADQEMTLKQNLHTVLRLRMWAVDSQIYQNEMNGNKWISSLVTIKSKHWKCLTSYIDITKDMLQLITNYIRDYYIQESYQLNQSCVNCLFIISLKCNYLVGELKWQTVSLLQYRSFASRADN